MRNITLKIDDETYHKARIRAARDGTSVSSMVRAYLSGLVAGEDSGQPSHRSIVAELEKIYAEADAGAKPRPKPLAPLSREEIYAKRVR